MTKNSDNEQFTIRDRANKDGISMFEAMDRIAAEAAVREDGCPIEAHTSDCRDRQARRTLFLEHQAEAERLLRIADEGGGMSIDFALPWATAHATLALTYKEN